MWSTSRACNPLRFAAHFSNKYKYPAALGSAAKVRAEGPEAVNEAPAGRPAAVPRTAPEDLAENPGKNTAQAARRTVARTTAEQQRLDMRADGRAHLGSSQKGYGGRLFVSPPIGTTQRIAPIRLEPKWLRTHTGIAIAIAIVIAVAIYIW